jgi:hypothetical protein
MLSELDIQAVRDEVEQAELKWGMDFDDKNTLNDWVAYIGMYSTDAAKIEVQHNPDYQYAQLIKAAGLCINAATRVREGRLQLRHYD